jgi:hypothetical protein
MELIADKNAGIFLATKCGVVVDFVDVFYVCLLDQNP